MNTAAEILPKSGWRFPPWLWVVAAFGVQFAVWTAWFVIAAHHPVQEVPLVGAEDTRHRAQDPVKQAERTGRRAELP